MSIQKILFPSAESRIQKWISIYQRDGHRWGYLPSLTAHLSLADIKELKQDKGSLLELGCGYGRDINFFSKCFTKLKISGIDPAIRYFRSTKGTIAYFNHQYKLFDLNVFEFFQKQSIEKKYDVIYSNYFFHLFESNEISQILKLTRNVMTDNGIFISNFISTEDIRFKKFNATENIGRTKDGIIWTFFTATMIKNLLEENGFIVENIYKFSELEFIKDKHDIVHCYYLLARKK